MRPSDPRSRESEEWVERRAFQAMISGNIQAAKAHQKTRAKIGFPEKGKALGRIFSAVVYTLRVGFGTSDWFQVGMLRLRGAFAS